MLKSFRVAALAAGLGVVAFAAAGPLSDPPATAQTPPQLSVLSTYQADAGFDETGAEIVAYADGRMYVVNGAKRAIEVVDISDPSTPSHLFDIDVAPWGGDVTSVAVGRQMIVAAVPAEVKTDAGQAVFFDLDGEFMSAAPTGALPDMVTFTPNGSWVVVANEGEPSEDYSIDPEGSVTVIKTAGAKMGRPVVPAIAVSQVTFEAFNEAGARHTELPDDLRIFGPGASVAQDLEPEYIAVSPDNRKAYISLQENNGILVVDVMRAQVDEIRALGFKDHSVEGNGIDASDEDGEINITTWPVSGVYMPDSVATYRVQGRDYVLTANEGDAREWGDYVEGERLKDVVEVTPLCADVFPNADELVADEALGRLNITQANGLREEGEGAPCYEEIYAFGARSFSIWGPEGELVFDSGDAFEQITADANPDFFNSNNDENSLETRSDDKGPEPEAITLGEVAGRTYAFIGLERVGGVMVYDVTDPTSPSFVQYLNNRDFTADPPAPDSGPEGFSFIDASDSPTGSPLLLVANELTATVSVYEFE